INRRSIPGVGDLLELAGSEALVAYADRTPAPPPVEIGGAGVVSERPNDEPAHLPRIELVTARLKQPLAEAQALVGRGDVDLVTLSLVLAAHAGGAERRIAGHLCADLEHEHAVPGFDGRHPPVAAATADHAV